MTTQEPPEGYYNSALFYSAPVPGMLEYLVVNIMSLLRNQGLHYLSSPRLFCFPSHIGCCLFEEMVLKSAVW